MKKARDVMLGKAEKWSRLWLMMFQVFLSFVDADNSSRI
jgi:hypothetical protein